MRFSTATGLMLCISMGVPVHAWAPLQPSPRRTLVPLAYKTESLDDSLYDKNEFFSRALLRARLELEQKQKASVRTNSSEQTQRKLLQTRLELEQLDRYRQLKLEEEPRAVLGAPSLQDEEETRAGLNTPTPPKEPRSTLDLQEATARALLKTRLDMEQKQKKLREQPKAVLITPPPTDESKAAVMIPPPPMEEPLPTKTASSVPEDSQLLQQAISYGKVSPKSISSKQEKTQRALLKARLDLQQRRINIPSGKKEPPLPPNVAKKETNLDGSNMRALLEARLESEQKQRQKAKATIITPTPLAEATIASAEETNVLIPTNRETSPTANTAVDEAPLTPQEPALGMTSIEADQPSTPLEVKSPESRSKSVPYFISEKISAPERKKEELPSAPKAAIEPSFSFSNVKPTVPKLDLAKVTIPPEAMAIAVQVTKSLWKGCTVLAKEGLDLAVQAMDGFSTSKVGDSDITYPEALEKVATCLKGLAKLCLVLGEGAKLSIAWVVEAAAKELQQQQKKQPTAATILREEENTAKVRSVFNNAAATALNSSVTKEETKSESDTSVPPAFFLDIKD